MDMGTHCLDLLEWLIGPIDRIGCLFETVTHAYEVEDTATALLHFANGAQGVVDVNFNVPDAAARNVLENSGGTRGAVYADHTIGQDAGGGVSLLLPEAVGGYGTGQGVTTATSVGSCTTSASTCTVPKRRLSLPLSRAACRRSPAAR